MSIVTRFANCGPGYMSRSQKPRHRGVLKAPCLVASKRLHVDGFSIMSTRPCLLFDAKRLICGGWCMISAVVPPAHASISLKALDSVSFIPFVHCISIDFGCA